MKKVIFSFLSLFISSLALEAQTVTGTLVGIGTDSVGVYARPSADIVNFTPLNIVFCISILDQGGSNPTTAELSTAIKIYTPNLVLVALKFCCISDVINVLLYILQIEPNPCQEYLLSPDEYPPKILLVVKVVERAVDNVCFKFPLR